MIAPTCTNRADKPAKKPCIPRVVYISETTEVKDVDETDDDLSLVLYVEVNMTSPGCDNRHAKIDASRAAPKETSSLTSEAAMFALAAAAYNIAAKVSNDTCFANVYGTCFDSIAGNPLNKPAISPLDSSINFGIAVTKFDAKLGSVTSRTLAFSIGTNINDAVAPATILAIKYGIAGLSSPKRFEISGFNASYKPNLAAPSNPYLIY